MRRRGCGSYARPAPCVTTNTSSRQHYSHCHNRGNKPVRHTHKHIIHTRHHICFTQHTINITLAFPSCLSRLLVSCAALVVCVSSVLLGVRLTRGAVRVAVSQATPPHLRPRLLARLPLPTLDMATAEDLCNARAAKGRRKGKRGRESYEHKTGVLVGVAQHVVMGLKEDLLLDLLDYMQLPTRRLHD